MEIIFEYEESGDPAERKEDDFFHVSHDIHLDADVKQKPDEMFPKDAAGKAKHAQNKYGRMLCAVYFERSLTGGRISEKNGGELDKHSDGPEVD